jgi:hypothetical protein
MASQRLHTANILTSPRPAVRRRVPARVLHRQGRSRPGVAAEQTLAYPRLIGVLLIFIGYQRRPGLYLGGHEFSRRPHAEATQRVIGEVGKRLREAH